MSIGNFKAKKLIFDKNWGGRDYFRGQSFALFDTTMK